jgi:hypothetical protein
MKKAGQLTAIQPGSHSDEERRPAGSIGFIILDGGNNG